MAVDEKTQSMIDKLKEKHEAAVTKLAAKHETALEKATVAGAKTMKASALEQVKLSTDEFKAIDATNLTKEDKTSILNIFKSLLGAIKAA